MGLTRCRSRKISTAAVGHYRACRTFFDVSDCQARCGISNEAMSVDERPRGLTATAIFMSITNAMGWTIIDWSKPNARTIFVMFTVTIAVNYFVIWFYWKGRNWARILLLLTSLLCLYNLRHWNHGGIAARIMVGAEAVLAIFLLYWLNTPTVRAFFRRQRAAVA